MKLFPTFPSAFLNTSFRLAKILNKDPKEIETDLTKVQMTRYLKEANSAIDICSDTFEKISEKLIEYIRSKFVLPQSETRISEIEEAKKRIK